MSGCLILTGLLIHSPFVGVCALWATACGTVAGYALRLPAARLDAGFYGYNGCLVGAAMATFSPLMRWPAFAWAAHPVVPDASFATATPAAFSLSDRNAGALLAITCVAIGTFGALSTLVQEALINSLNRRLKV